MSFFLRNAALPIAAVMFIMLLFFPKRASFFGPRTLFLGLAVAFLAMATTLLSCALSDSDSLGDLTGGDSANYLWIARQFAAGDFSMSYLHKWQSRQPLYPFLLSLPMRIGFGGFFWLGAVNIVIALATIFVIYETLKRYPDYRVSLTIAVLFALNRFVVEESSQRLVTEPLFILLTTLALVQYREFLRRDKVRNLLLTSAFAGFAYLTRPNGLFFMIGICAIQFYAEISSCARAAFEGHAGRIHLVKRLTAFAGCLLMFILVTIPSWVPRLRYFHNPVYYGPIGNFLWVDTYIEAHSSGGRIYSWRDYFHGHTAWDAVKRFGLGLWDVFVCAAPKVEHIPLLFILSLAGVYAAFAQKDRRLRLLAGVCAIQLLPLAWTSRSNPGIRIPYSAFITFEVLFAAFGLQWILNSKLGARFAAKEPLPVNSHHSAPGDAAGVSAGPQALT